MSLSQSSQLRTWAQIKPPVRASVRVGARWCDEVSNYMPHNTNVVPFTGRTSQKQLDIQALVQS